MEKIIWNENFSVGVREMDEQHKRLIGIINELIETDNTTVDSETIFDILTKMTNYALSHFEEEEQYMIKYNYPDYSIHKDQHSKFKDQLITFCKDTKVHKESIPTEIFSYLKTWFTNHILETDMAYKPFFNEKWLR
jgi:hemerythrin